MAYFEGNRIALAHALKLAIRSALASTTSPLTNLIHLDPSPNASAASSPNPLPSDEQM